MSFGNRFKAHTSARANTHTHTQAQKKPKKTKKTKQKKTHLSATGRAYMHTCAFFSTYFGIFLLNYSLRQGCVVLKVVQTSA